MNTFFAVVDWSLISSKVAALMALIFFAKQPLKVMLLGKPSNDWREQVEHSLLVVAVISMVFHFFGRLSSDAILSAEISKQMKIQLYYFFFAFYELIYVTCIIKWHRFKNCVVAKYSRYVCYMSVAMAVLLVCRYADRTVLETNAMDGIYGYLVASINLVTLCLIGAYPAYRLFKFIPDKKWV
ncbi:hypothetical protein [Pseudoalteromonas obscura]|uniref:Uncharacterized protein n=1 Tax=Pseudoalteromonas obscura TaxID=3048491 RepID=A0ABT7EUB9_9GAMM|nr:hypothetical protein [Pseudoalteromonas sp. P94(2023)]MDK2598643.1 hypothetical protein [Pseudoalteromonas sp. P94(2023)]